MELCLLNLLILTDYILCNSYPWSLGKFTSFIFSNFEISLISLGRFQNFKKVNSVNLSQISLLNMWLLAQMWSLDQSLVTPLFYQRSYHNLSFIRIWREKILFVFEGCFWFKFNNLELALGMAWKFYTSVAKDLKLEIRKLWRLIPTFVEFTGENC